MCMYMRESVWEREQSKKDREREREKERESEREIEEMERQLRLSEGSNVAEEKGRERMRDIEK